MIVADTNLISYLLIEGEQTDRARRVWQRDPTWIMPSLWRSEYLSVLTVSTRAGVLTATKAHAAWQAGIRLFGASEREPRGDAVLDIALELAISAYDAQFVVVAKDASAQLVTGDRKLIRACGAMAISVDEFSRQ